jgi:hypothetical protein
MAAEGTSWAEELQQEEAVEGALDVRTVDGCLCGQRQVAKGDIWLCGVRVYSKQKRLTGAARKAARAARQTQKLQAKLTRAQALEQATAESASRAKEAARTREQGRWQRSQRQLSTAVSRALPSWNGSVHLD